MQIRMHVKEGGLVAFVCEGVLTEPLEKIVLNRDTRLFSLVFKDSGEEVELDCPVGDEILQAIGHHKYCVMGFCNGDTILGAAMVPVEGVQNL